MSGRRGGWVGLGERSRDSENGLLSSPLLALSSRWPVNTSYWKNYVTDLKMVNYSSCYMNYMNCLSCYMNHTNNSYPFFFHFILIK